MGILDWAAKTVKQVTGIQAYQDRKEAERLTQEADNVKAWVDSENERIKKQLDAKIQHFQYVEKEVLKKTISVFMDYNKHLKFNRDNKYFPQIQNIDLKNPIYNPPDVHFQTKEILKTVGMGVAFGVFAAGYTASKIYAQKLTEATAYHSKVMSYKAQCERQWVIMNGIIMRTDEMETNISALGSRAEKQLRYLEPLIYEFMQDDPWYIRVFQNVGLLLGAIYKIAETPLMEEVNNTAQWTNLRVEVKQLLDKNI